MSAPVLSQLDVAVAALALVLCAGASAALSLGIARTLLIAGARMVGQLLLLAVVLRWLFALQSPAVTALAMLAMAGFAGVEVMNRQSRLAGRGWTLGLGAGVMLAGGWLVTVPALALLVRADPWHAPQVALPLFGMVAGSAMTGVALGLDTFARTVTREARAIEGRLALGATREAALADARREAIRTGLMPVLNAMAATGVVTIPGMMTGQILAGADPMQAARYQMLVMFLIATVSVGGTIGAVHALARRLTDERHRLRLDRLRGSG
ncbi:ABC transporter permease [Aestuariibius sp. 2305UL40-4]|uniref:ABC transporter permease n=1 Tax=Aestuariibius violaceus TaxID=3234132 RepID=UPI00345ED295